MQESKREGNRTTEGKRDDTKQTPDSEATSKKTLRDLEDSKEHVGSSGASPDPGPSPDGAFDEAKKRARFRFGS